MPVWKYSLVDGPDRGTEFLFETTSGLPDFNFGPNQLRWSGADQLVSLFKGSGITADGLDIVSGRITSVTMRLSGDVALSGTGLSFSAKILYDRMAAQAGEGVAALSFSGRDKIFGSTRGEDLYGFKGADTIFGNKGDDYLYGGNGDDSLYGGGGNDIVVGDAGNALLNGGVGIDVLVGNDGGKDRFLFNSNVGAANADTIVDFNASNDDRILLDNDIFTTLGRPGTLNAAKFRIGTEAGDQSDRIIYDDATGRLYYDKDGTGAAAQRLIAVMEDGGLGPSLTVADFGIVN